jgi:hypothetical protein
MLRSWLIPLLLLAALIGQATGAVVPSTGVSLSITVTVNPGSVPSSPPATITAAVSGDDDGDGVLDRLTLTFSRTVDISDGGGAGDGLDAFALSNGYTIAAQDYSATNTTSLVLRLAPGAADTAALISPTYRSGFTSTIRNAGGGTLMANATTVTGSDGAAPVITGVRPLSGSVASDTRVSYTLSEALASGTMQWTRVGGAADATVHVQTLSGSELAAGVHDAILLADDPALVDGAIYDVVIAGSDAAGHPALAVTRSGVTYRLRKRPRIVSESPLWVVTGQPWTYDVLVDVRELGLGHALRLPDSLVFAVVSAPPGVTITKTGPITARVQWPSSTAGPHHLITISVTDSETGTSDRQDVLLYVVPAPSGGG